jgi:hypothetical protein
MINYNNKYIKYKLKYYNLVNMIGGKFITNNEINKKYR